MLCCPRSKSCWDAVWSSRRKWIRMVTCRPTKDDVLSKDTPRRKEQTTIDCSSQPVAALNTPRNQCCFALQKNQHLKSFDFEQAFVQVQALPDIDIYIRWPLGIRPLRDLQSGQDTCLKSEKRFMDPNRAQGAGA